MEAARRGAGVLGLLRGFVLAIAAVGLRQQPRARAIWPATRAAPRRRVRARDFAVNAGDLVYFSTDSVDLSQEAQQTLANQARWLKQYAQHTITSRAMPTSAAPANTTSRWVPSVPRRCAITWSGTASTPRAYARCPSARSARWRSATTSPAGRRTAGPRPHSAAARTARTSWLTGGGHPPAHAARLLGYPTAKRASPFARFGCRRHNSGAAACSIDGVVLNRATDRPWLPDAARNDGHHGLCAEKRDARRCGCARHCFGRFPGAGPADAPRCAFRSARPSQGASCCRARGSSTLGGWWPAAPRRATGRATGRPPGRDRHAGVSGQGHRRRAAGPRAPSGPSAAVSAADAGRLDAIETQIRALAAQLEGLQEQVRTLASRSGSADGPPPRFGSVTVEPEGPKDEIDRVMTPPPGGGPPPRITAASPPGRGDADAEPQQLYEQAYGYLLQKDYRSAETGFEDFLRRHPNHQLAGNAQYWLGEAFYVRGQYRAAAGAFLKGYQTYARSPKAPETLLKLAMSLQRLGQKDAACSSFSELATKYPNPPAHVRSMAQAERQRGGC